MQLDLFPIIAETILLNDDGAIPRLLVLNKDLPSQRKKPIYRDIQDIQGKN